MHPIVDAILRSLPLYTESRDACLDQPDSCAEVCKSEQVGAACRLSLAGVCDVLYPREEEEGDALEMNEFKRLPWPVAWIEGLGSMLTVQLRIVVERGSDANKDGVVHGSHPSVKLLVIDYSMTAGANQCVMIMLSFPLKMSC